MTNISRKAFQAFQTLVEWYPHGFSDKAADQRISQRFVDEYIATLDPAKQVGIGGSYWTFLMTWRMLGWIEPTHKGWAYTECGRYAATMADLLQDVDPPVEKEPCPDEDMNVFSTTLPVGTPYIDFVLCGESTRVVGLPLDLVLEEPNLTGDTFPLQELPLELNLDSEVLSEPEIDRSILARFGFSETPEVEEVECTPFGQPCYN